MTEADIPLRPAISAAMKEARNEYEAARRRFSAPYSGADAAQAFYVARGRMEGLGWALEILDSGARDD